MTAWRNVIFSGFIGACLFAGCTVTTGGSNTDGGVFDETGGSPGTGGTAGTTGGSNTGGTTGPATTVVQCTPNYVDSPNNHCGDNKGDCDSCLQTHHCEAPFKECYVDSQCEALVNAMMNCMVDQFNLGQTDPTTASETCQQDPTIAIWQPTAGTSQARAQTLWHEIEGSPYCIEVCCGFIAHH